MGSSIDVAVVPQLVPSTWTQQSNKTFETALAEHAHDIDTPDGWRNIGAKLHGMYSDEELSERWRNLSEDVNAIEAGRIALPDYVERSFCASSDGDSPCNKKDAYARPGNGRGTSLGVSAGAGNAGSGKGSSTKSTDPERRKGVAWSEDEHRLFLLGLDKFGKGDWRSISRNFVTTRTPTQVASHAQKYYIRMNSMNNKDKRRSSIHDITSVSDGGDFPGPITGVVSSNSTQQSSSSLRIDGALYGMGQMGLPRDHPIANQVLMAPVGHSHHVPYGQVPVMQAPSVPMQHMATVYPRSQCANA